MLLVFLAVRSHSPSLFFFSLLSGRNFPPEALLQNCGMLTGRSMFLVLAPTEEHVRMCGVCASQPTYKNNNKVMQLTFYGLCIRANNKLSRVFAKLIYF